MEQEVVRPKFDPSDPAFLSDEDFYLLRIKAVMRIPSLAPEFKGLQVRYNLFRIGMGIGDVTPEYLCRYKNKMVGLHCFNIRQANEDDPVRCLKFMRKIVSGEMHPAIWMYMRSFGELVRVEKGASGRPKAMKEVITKAETEYGPAATLEKAYQENLRFKNDIERVASRREELVADKIRAEAPGLEYLGADGGVFVKAQIKARTEELRRDNKLKDGEEAQFVFPEAVKNGE